MGLGLHGPGTQEPRYPLWVLFLSPPWRTMRGSRGTRYREVLHMRLLNLLGPPGAKASVPVFHREKPRLRPGRGQGQAGGRGEARNRSLVSWPPRRLTPTSVRSIPSQLALKPTPAVTKSPAPGRQPVAEPSALASWRGAERYLGPPHPGASVPSRAHAGSPAPSGLSGSPFDPVSQFYA